MDSRGARARGFRRRHPAWPRRMSMSTSLRRPACPWRQALPSGRTTCSRPKAAQFGLPLGTRYRWLPAQCPLPAIGSRALGRAYCFFFARASGRAGRRRSGNRNRIRSVEGAGANRPAGEDEGLARRQMPGQLQVEETMIKTLLTGSSAARHYGDGIGPDRRILPDRVGIGLARG